MTIAGLGPHGEIASPFERLHISEADAAKARDRQFSLAVVIHTTESDWSRQQLAGIVGTLGYYAASVVEVVDCSFDSDKQRAALARLASEKLDAIVSLPIGNREVAEAHAEVSRRGTKLILLDNAPTGLIPGVDYEGVVSADNFGLGQIGARLLSPGVAHGGLVGILTYGADFFVTNERDIAFRKWMASERPDITLCHGKFRDPAEAETAAYRLLDANPKLAGLYVVWDEPAMPAVAALKQRGLLIPVTTTDLGYEAALELARDGLISGIGAQQPYNQGVATARTAIRALLGHQSPPWIALPGLPVTHSNVIESYQIVWQVAAPKELVQVRRSALSPRLSSHYEHSKGGPFGPD